MTRKGGAGALSVCRIITNWGWEGIITFLIYLLRSSKWRSGEIKYKLVCRTLIKRERAPCACTCFTRQRTPKLYSLSSAKWNSFDWKMDYTNHWRKYMKSKWKCCVFKCVRPPIPFNHPYLLRGNNWGCLKCTPIFSVPAEKRERVQRCPSG